MLYFISKAIHKIYPHYYGFLGGVFISTATNLFINILGNIKNKNMVILSSVLIFFAGFFCTSIGWKINFNLRASIDNAKNFSEKEAFLDSYIEKDAILLSFFLTATIVLFIIGFVIIGYVA